MTADDIAHGGYYTRKKLRSEIYNVSPAEYTKHIKAKTVEDARKMSMNGGNAQYLPGINNNAIEKQALMKGNIVKYKDKGVTYYIYNAGEIIGYDSGIATSWIRAELSSGFYHGHPIAGERLANYLRDAMPR